MTLARTRAAEVVYDRGMRGLVWIVALAACAKQGGVQISVSENGTATKTVRIFVGAGAPTKSATIVAAGGSAHVGTYWARDPAVGTDTATMTGNHVDWVFEPSGGPTVLPIVIAVGFAASGAIVGTGKLEGVQVPDSGFLTYDIPLGPPGTATTWDADHATPTVDATCVAIGAAKAEDMIVSPDDEDCDNFLDGKPEECEPLVYKAATARTALPDELDCFGLSAQTAQCMAGGPTCLDGHGPVVPTGVACPLSSYCAPGNVCECTTFDCLPSSTGPGMTPQIPRYECTIALEPDGQGAKLCEDTLVLPAGTGTDCTNVRLRNAQQNFLSTLSVDSDTRSVRIDAHSKDCAIKLEPRGTIGKTLNGMPDNNPIVSLMAVDSVATPFSGFVVPVVFRFGDASKGCGTSGCTQLFGIGGTDRGHVCTAFTGN